ncbi:MAG: type III-B CRISPR module RAMP protein Cmr1 [Lentisphaeria bacterium]|nr:type III-B CRISPR module RAMP protein Cmr1 [Lentisphaeria bacterium]
MNQATYSFELITPCFCAGADPTRAEIRVPSIRGQLRWWFRALGGFGSMRGIAVREQECMVFGSTAGETGRASPLILRLDRPISSRVVMDSDAMDAPVLSDKGYLLFPLRSNPKKGVYAGRGVFPASALPRFDLHVVWRGPEGLWADIQALLGLFGHLGSLGFRSRRGMGALAFAHDPPDLAGALRHFSNPQGVRIRTMDAASADDAIVKLARWLKDWRAHGRTTDHPTARAPAPPHNSGFPYAKADHDQGANALAATGRAPNGPTFRPALGLPVVQFFSSRSRPNVVNWEQGRGKGNEAKGRFASPVVLRPHRDARGHWRALVLFIERHRWPTDRPVYLNGQAYPVALALYEAMQQDKRLERFP